MTRDIIVPPWKQTPADELARDGALAIRVATPALAAAWRTYPVEVIGEASLREPEPGSWFGEIFSA